jgi:hypothetical protein
MLPKPIHADVSLAPQEILKLSRCLLKVQYLAIYEDLDVLAANYWHCISWMVVENCNNALTKCDVSSGGDDDNDN